MILAIIAMIIVGIVAVIAVYKYYEYLNPYVDEVIKDTPIWDNRGNQIIARGYQFKRTYKNGKVVYVSKTVMN